MLQQYDFERLIDYVKYLPDTKQAELNAKNSREREAAKETREWYEAEIQKLKAKLGRAQKKLLDEPKLKTQDVVGLYVSEKTCVMCGMWFKPKAPNQTCCNNDCRQARRRMFWRARVHEIAVGDRCVVALGQEIACKWCGKTFVKKNSSHKYCCTECSVAADKKRSKTCYINKVRLKFCEMCGTSFMYSTHARRYCSQACAQRAKGKNTKIKSIVEMATTRQQNVIVG
ncbi:MAG: hypothetical protein ACKN9T_18245 [Candidatus Methylumidiphilus sp.]